MSDTMNALQTRIEDFVDSESLKNTVQDMIDLALKKGATSCEVGANISQGLSLNVRKQSLENIEFNRDKGIGLTVYVGHKKGSASTNDLSLKAIERTVDAALNLAKYTQEDPFSGLADKESLAFNLIDCDLYHPWTLSMDEMKQWAFECEDYALKADPRISNSEGASLGTSQSYRVYGNSHGFIGAYPSTRHGLSCVVIAQDKHGMQRDYQYTSSRNPEKLWSPKRIGIEAAQRAVSRLSSKPIETQKLPVIFRNNVAATLFGHFCSAISGGRLYRKSSFLQDCKGESIFHPKIQLSENPHLKQAIGSSSFDGDGVQTKSRDLIKNGIVQDYILSAYSSRKLNLPNTANAGGVRNLILASTDASLEDLILSQEKALFVTDVMGQGVNLLTGDYSRGAAGFLIENGQLTKPVSEVTIASNLKDMFQRMSCVSNDVDTRGNTQTGSVLVEMMTVAGS